MAEILAVLILDPLRDAYADIIPSLQPRAIRLFQVVITESWQGVGVVL